MIEAVLRAAGYAVEHVLGSTSIRGVAIARDPRGTRVLVTAIPPHPDVERALAAVEAPELAIVAQTTMNGPEGELFVLVEALPEGTSSLHPRWIGGAPTLVPKWSVALAELVDRRRQEAAILLPSVHPALVFVSENAPWVHALGRRTLPLLELRDHRNLDESGPVLRGLYGPLTTPSLVDDVFRVGAVIWHWRHGNGPFRTDFEGLEALRRGQPRHAPRDDVDRLLVSCFAPRSDDRPAFSTLLEGLRDEPAWPWSDRRYLGAPAAAAAMTKHLRELRAAGVIASATLHYEVTMLVAPDGEHLDALAEVSFRTPDGRADAFRFGGDAEGLRDWMARRVKPTKPAPVPANVRPLEELRARTRAPERTVVGVPFQVATRRALLRDVAARIEARLGPAKVPLRRALVDAQLRSTSQFVSDLEVDEQHHSAVLAVSLDLRCEAASVSPRLHGEEHDPTDGERSVLVERTFGAPPSDAEIDAFVADAWNSAAPK